MIMGNKMFALAILAGLALTACGQPTASERLAEGTPVQVQEPVDTEETLVKGPLDMTRLPFGVVNNLSVEIVVQVGDVDPYDWLTSSAAGRPDDAQPRGFSNEIVGPGSSIAAWFEPSARAKGAPFELRFSGIDPSVISGIQKLTSVSFDKVFYCESLPVAAKAPCNSLSRSHFKGWAYRTGSYSNIEDQWPQVCNRTSPEFTYKNAGLITRAHGRIDCASQSTAMLAPAFILEDIK
jgi:hypothetical protein